jgi:neural Wiskott-Aldrich syndrome protein
MPSTSNLSAAEKATVKKHTSSSTDKVGHNAFFHAVRGGGARSILRDNALLQILAAAVGRIYYAYPNPSRWTWSGLEGAIAFGKTEQGRGGFWLRLVDIVVCRNFFFYRRLTAILPNPLVLTSCKLKGDKRCHVGT